FEGVELVGDAAVLHYRIGPTLVREWYQARSVGETVRLSRHVVLEPHDEPVVLALGAPAGKAWTHVERGTATADLGDGVQLRWSTASPAVSLGEHRDEVFATFAPSGTAQQATIVLQQGPASAALPADAGVH